MSINSGRYDTIVIGGGPAGLFTALNLTDQNVLLVEKGQRPGRKLLISGTGQCNFTHSGLISDFLSHYGTNHRFIRHALHAFSNHHLISFYKSAGIESYEDKNGKIFPASLKSSDILKVLLNSCKDKKVNILNATPVTQVELVDGCYNVTCGKTIFISRNLVIATGGLSYPSTGSTGDGYRFAENLGHTIVKPRPALSPVLIRNYQMADLSGISLPDVLISLFHNGRKTGEHRGDIVFTLKGLSGPGILDFSRYISEGDLLKINLIDVNPAAFSDALIQSARTNGKSTLQSWLKSGNVPKNLLRFLIEQAGATPDMRLAEIQKKIRISLAEMLCECPFIVEKPGGYKTAMATAGGVSIDEISPNTMESRIVKNLYFSGEVIDIDGDTGGYNIQAAFSTAFVAAKAINSKRQQFKQSG
ncbi:MAG: NAD(P)/FAD-dependent oxidoreductase [Bacteroidota bacterium]